MNSEMGVFALRQIVSSMVVVGPILFMIGAFNYVFNQNRKLVLAYLLSGMLLTVVGAANLYREFASQDVNRDASVLPSPEAIHAQQENQDKL